MSFEGTTNPVVEETVVSPAVEVETNDVAETNENDSPEVDENGEEVSPPAPVDDLEEIEFEGEKIKVPKKVKEGLLRNADYTRKTQELAEQRKAFEATRETSVSVHKDYVEALANVKAYDGALKRYDNVDWASFEQTDPTRAASEWRQFSQLKEARDTAEKSATNTEQRLALESQRARATRVQEVQTELTKIMPDWAPNNELDQKLSKFGTANGLSAQDLADATLRNPNFVKLLNLARIGAELQTKQANTKRIEAAQAVKPAAEVGSRSTTTVKDPAKMNQAAYVKWRMAQG